MVYAHRQAVILGGDLKKILKNYVVFNPLSVSLVSHGGFDEGRLAHRPEIPKKKPKMNTKVKCWNQDHTL